MNNVVTVTAIIYASLFLNFFLVASFDNLSVRLAASHDISLQELSIILSVKSFVNMLFGPMFALMSSKLPAALLFTIGSFCVAAAMTGIAFSVSPAGFLISRALHGVGTSGLMVGGMSVLMRSVPKNQRGRYSSIAYSSAGHAPLVAPILSGLMYDSMGQTWSFLIPAIITFTVSSVSYILLARIMSVPRIQSSDSQLQTIEKRLIWPCVKSMFSSPLTYVALIGVFSDGFSFGSCESVLPALLIEWDGGALSVLTTSLIYSVGPLAFTIMAPISGYLVDKKGHQKVLLLGLLLYVGLMPLFHIFDDSLVGIGGCLAIAFGVAAICEVAIYPFIAEVAEATKIPHADTIAYALNELFIQGGYAIGNVTGRLLIDWGGTLAMGVFIASWDAIAVAASLSVVWYIRRKSAATDFQPKLSSPSTADTSKIEA